jgi:amino acid permease
MYFGHVFSAKQPKINISELGYKTKEMCRVLKRIKGKNKLCNLNFANCQMYFQYNVITFIIIMIVCMNDFHKFNENTDKLTTNLDCNRKISHRIFNFWIRIPIVCAVYSYYQVVDSDLWCNNEFPLPHPTSHPSFNIYKTLRGCCK